MQPTKIKTVAPKKIRYRQTKPEQLYSLSDILNGVPIPEEEATPADLADIEGAEKDLREGNVFTADEIKGEFGSLSDILNGVPIPEEEVSPAEKAILDKLLAELHSDRASGNMDGYVSLDELKKELGLRSD